MGWGSWDHWEQRSNSGPDSQEFSIQSSLIPLGLYQETGVWGPPPYLTLGWRAEPGPWKLPWLTLPIWCVALGKSPTHICLHLGSQTRYFLSEPFPVESQPVLT